MSLLIIAYYLVLEAIDRLYRGESQNVLRS